MLTTAQCGRNAYLATLVSTDLVNIWLLDKQPELRRRLKIYPQPGKWFLPACIDARSIARVRLSKLLPPGTDDMTSMMPQMETYGMAEEHLSAAFQITALQLLSHSSGDSDVVLVVGALCNQVNRQLHISCTELSSLGHSAPMKKSVQLSIKGTEFTDCGNRSQIASCLCGSCTIIIIQQQSFCLI